VRLLPLAAAAIALLALTGCARALSLPPADDASDPACAAVMVTLPQEIGDESLPVPLEQRDTTSQGSSAWGDPSAITLRCGMPVPAPSTDRCIGIEITPGRTVDWLEVAQEDSVWTFVSYGRSPATEVVVDTSVVTASTALDAVSNAVDRTELVGACT
jgi:predicted small lipoprotein YifL